MDKMATTISTYDKSAEAYVEELSLFCMLLKSGSKI